MTSDFSKKILMFYFPAILMFEKFTNLQFQLKFNTISLVQREKGKIFLLIESLKTQSLIII